MESEIQQIQKQISEDVKTEFRKIYYSSLLQQRQENATNRVKIAAISIGITIAGIVGVIGKGIESFSDLLLPFLIFIVSYLPWLRLIYVVFRKLEIDDNVIDEKIATIGTPKEYEDTESKELADKFEKKFRWSLIVALIGIICIPICILISTFFMEEDRVKEKVKTIEITPAGEVIMRMIPDDKDANNNSQGGKLPGFFDTEQRESNPNANENREATTAQETVSENPSGNANQETKTEQNQ